MGDCVLTAPLDLRVLLLLQLLLQEDVCCKRLLFLPKKPLRLNE
jgi:hypothetical protein